MSKARKFDPQTADWSLPDAELGRIHGVSRQYASQWRHALHRDRSRIPELGRCVDATMRLHGVSRYRAEIWHRASGLRATVGRPLGRKNRTAPERDELEGMSVLDVMRAFVTSEPTARKWLKLRGVIPES